MVKLKLALVVFLLLALSFFSFAASEKWRFETENYISSQPALSSGLIYFGSADGSVYAVDAARGTLTWNYSTRGEVLSSPLIANNLVYIGSNDHYLYALNAQTGKEEWKFKTSGQVTTMPAFEDNTIYTVSSIGDVYALDSGTGAQLWKYTVNGTIYASPLASGGKIYVGASDGNLYAISASTGLLAWKFKANGAIWKSSPSISNSLIYFGANDNFIYAVTPSGNLRWKYETEGWVASSPRAFGSNLYVGSNDGFVYTFEAATGKLLWQFKTGDAVQSAPTFATISGGVKVVYIGGNDGYIYALQEDGKPLWAYSIGDWVSTPVIKENMLYVTSRDGALHAVSSLSCEITSPKQGSSLAYDTQLEGTAYGDRGIQAIYVKIGDGSWSRLPAAGIAWKYPFALSSLPLGTISVSCKVTDNNGVEETSPYSTITYQHVAPEQLPKMFINYPKSTSIGGLVEITFADQATAPISNVTVTLPSGEQLSSNDKGIARFYAPAQRPLLINATHQNFAPQTLEIAVETTDNTMLFIAGGVGIIILLVLVFLKMRKKEEGKEEAKK
ncbi:MAG: PQQ-binding-like beta-propeller repeat protein [Candidatus Micrarchaeota archaeon]